MRLGWRISAEIDDEESIRARSSTWFASGEASEDFFACRHFMVDRFCDGVALDVVEARGSWRVERAGASLAEIRRALQRNGSTRENGAHRRDQGAEKTRARCGG
jgi:hypothetical protein